MRTDSTTGALTRGEETANRPFRAMRDIVFVDSLPTNPSGKVLKRELVVRFAAD